MSTEISGTTPRRGNSDVHYVAQAATVTSARPQLHRRGYTTISRRSGIDYSGRPQPSPPQALGAQWHADHFNGAVQAYFTPSQIPSTLTHGLAAFTAAAESLGSNKVIQVGTASLSAVAAVAELVKSIRNGNVAPAAASTFSSVGAALIAGAALAHGANKERMTWAGRACIATGVFINQYDSGAKHGLHVAETRDIRLEEGSSAQMNSVSPSARLHPAPTRDRVDSILPMPAAAGALSHSPRSLSRNSTS